MNKFLLSNIALVVGVLALITGITSPSALGIAGAVIILGTLAYQSAKKRKLGLVKNTTLRKTTEGIIIVITFLIIFLQTDIQRLIIEDPVPNILIPIWVWGAYFIIVFRKPKQEKLSENKK